MPQNRSRHAAPRQQPWRRAWGTSDRGELAILLCGVLTFLSFTFGAPLFHPAPQLSVGNSTASAVVVAGGPASPPHTPAGPASFGVAPAGVAPAGAAPIAGTGAAASAAAPEPGAAAQIPGTASPEVAAGPALPAAARPIRIRYPSAAFDVAVQPLDLDGEAQSSRTIEPPATKDGYWLTPFGIPGSGSGNTTYIIGHSWEGADAPFNHLSSATAVGDRFDVETTAGTINYRVESITTYLKSGLKDSSVWDMVPNRLVLISCYTEDPWGKNVVVTAYPASP